MTEEKKDAPASEEKKEEKKGFFTEGLSTWQIVLVMIFVGYLVYGKYQETKEKGAPQPPAVTVPAK